MYLTKEAKQEAYKGFENIMKDISKTEIPTKCKDRLYQKINGIFNYCSENFKREIIRDCIHNLEIYISALVDADYIDIIFYDDIDIDIYKAIKKANEIYINQYKEMESKKECNKY